MKQNEILYQVIEYTATTVPFYTILWVCTYTLVCWLCSCVTLVRAPGLGFQTLGEINRYSK